MNRRTPDTGDVLETKIISFYPPTDSLRNALKLHGFDGDGDIINDAVRFGTLLGKIEEAAQESDSRVLLDLEYLFDESTHPLTKGVLDDNATPHVFIFPSTGGLAALLRAYVLTDLGCWMEHGDDCAPITIFTWDSRKGLNKINYYAGG